jgi:hypothetical protein
MTGGRIPTSELDETFGRIANGSRLAILQALWNADEPLAYTAIKERIGMRDSGKFNYHLRELRPGFVRQTETGYELTHAGRRVIGAAVSGDYTDADSVTIGPVPAGDCMFCDGTAEARYEEGRVIVDCPECEKLITSMPLAPIAVDGHDREALPGVFNDHVRKRITGLNRGFCTLCGGRVERLLTVASSHEAVTSRSVLDVTFTCTACGDETHLNVGGVLTDHPVVVSFLFDAGIDLEETYIWELRSLLDPEATLVSEDPARLAVSVELGDDAIELTVDETVTVREYRRL